MFKGSTAIRRWAAQSYSVLYAAQYRKQLEDASGKGVFSSYSEAGPGIPTGLLWAVQGWSGQGQKSGSSTPPCSLDRFTNGPTLFPPQSISLALPNPPVLAILWQSRGWVWPLWADITVHAGPSASRCFIAVCGTLGQRKWHAPAKRHHRIAKGAISYLQNMKITVMFMNKTNIACKCVSCNIILFLKKWKAFWERTILKGAVWRGVFNPFPTNCFSILNSVSLPCFFLFNYVSMSKLKISWGQGECVEK